MSRPVQRHGSLSVLPQTSRSLWMVWAGGAGKPYMRNPPHPLSWATNLHQLETEYGVLLAAMHFLNSVRRTRNAVAGRIDADDRHQKWIEVSENGHWPVLLVAAWVVKSLWMERVQERRGKEGRLTDSSTNTKHPFRSRSVFSVAYFLIVDEHNILCQFRGLFGHRIKLSFPCSRCNDCWLK